MGNTWNYEIVLQKSRGIASSLFEQIFRVTQAIGYKLLFPTSVIALNGLDALEFHDVETLANHLGSEGGNFPIWNEAGQDILLAFLPQKGVFSFGVQYNLLADRHDKIAHDLEQLFFAFCIELKPRYGYSHDEWNLEVAFRGQEILTVWTQFENGVAKARIPPILFWLNYFEQEYFTRIGKEAFEKLQSFKFTQVQDGVFIQLASHPWAAKYATLENGKYSLLLPT
jgi:hypothetical protein